MTDVSMLFYSLVGACIILCTCNAMILEQKTTTPFQPLAQFSKDNTMYTLVHYVKYRMKARARGKYIA